MATASTIVGLIIITLLCYVIWRQRVVDQHVKNVEKVARSAHAEAQAGRVLSEAKPPQKPVSPRRKRRRRPDYLKPLIVIGACLACCLGWVRRRVWASVVVGAAASGMAAAPTMPSTLAPPAAAERSPRATAPATSQRPPELRATPSATAAAPPSTSEPSRSPTSTRTPRRSTPEPGGLDVAPPTQTPTATPLGSPPSERPSSSPPPATRRPAPSVVPGTPPGCSRIEVDVRVCTE